MPNTLTHLRLGYDYNFEFKKGILPPNLEYLELGGIYSHMLTEIPTSVKTLYICGSKENELMLTNLPESIETIIIFNLHIALTNLPINISKIILICYTEDTIKLLKKIPFNCKIYDKYSKEIKNS